jgi:hypothetical protein
VRPIAVETAGDIEDEEEREAELQEIEEVAEIYLGPTLTQRMRGRYARPEQLDAGVSAGA